MKSEAYEKIEAIYEEAVKLKKAAIIQLDKVLIQIVLKSRILDFRRKGPVAVDVCRSLLSGVAGKSGASKFHDLRKVVTRCQHGFKQKQFFRNARKLRNALHTT